MFDLKEIKFKQNIQFDRVSSQNLGEQACSVNDFLEHAEHPVKNCKRTKEKTIFLN